MARILTSLAIIVSLLACGKGSGPSSPTAPQPAPSLSGTWSGEATVMGIRPSDGGCGTIGYFHPVGVPQPVTATVSEGGGGLDLRFARHALLDRLDFAGSAAGSAVVARLDAASLAGFSYGCSPASPYFAARALAGDLTVRADVATISGSIDLQLETVDLATQRASSPPYHVSISISLRRSD